MGGILGLKRNRSVARLAANLLGVNGAMTVDTNNDGVVDGFTHEEVGMVPVLTLDGGQKVVLANATDAGAYIRVYLATSFVVLPNVSYTVSVDAALVRSGAEVIVPRINWYTGAGAWIADTGVAGYVNPGVSYSRQSVTGISPATAGKASCDFLVAAKAVGATGSAWFKDALFQPA